MMSTVGGWSPYESVNLDVIKICLEVKKPIEENLKRTLDIFIPLTFSTQIVAGKNYAVKIFIGLPDTMIRAEISQALPCNGGGLRLINVQIIKDL